MHGFLMHLDRDILGDAKAKVESSAKVAWRSSGEGGYGNVVHQQRRVTRKHKSLVLESPRTVRGHQISGAGVVPGHARRDGPTKTSNRREMIGVINKKNPSRATRGVPNVGKAIYHHRRQWIGGAPRMV